MITMITMIRTITMATRPKTKEVFVLLSLLAKFYTTRLFYRLAERPRIFCILRFVVLSYLLLLLFVLLSFSSLLAIFYPILCFIVHCITNAHCYDTLRIKDLLLFACLKEIPFEWLECMQQNAWTGQLFHPDSILVQLWLQLLFVILLLKQSNGQALVYIHR